MLMMLPLGGGADRVAPFQRPTAQERESFGEHARRARTPGVLIEKRGARTAVLAALGEKPTAGYEIRIVRIALSGSTVEVRASVSEPPGDAVLAQVITHPFDVVWIRTSRLARIKGPLTLRLTDQSGKPIGGEAGPAKM